MSKFKIIAYLVLGFIVYKVFVAVKNFEVGLDKQVAEIEKSFHKAKSTVAYTTFFMFETSWWTNQMPRAYCHPRNSSRH